MRLELTRAPGACERSAFVGVTLGFDRVRAADLCRTEDHGSTANLWNRHDQSPSPFPDERELRGDLLLEVPGKHEDIVRPRLADTLGRLDRDARSWEKLALLEVAPVDDIVR